MKKIELDDTTHQKEGFQTVGGFILHILEQLPKTGEIVSWHNFTFEVVDMDAMRIDKVLVKKI